MTSSAFIRQAQQVQAEEGNASPRAIPIYQKAIQAASSGNDDYDQLYAHYQLMWILSQSDPQQGIAYAEKCLAILRPAIEAGAIMHYTDYGQFQQEVIRHATNCIAWHSLEKTNDEPGLQALLDLMLLGINYGKVPDHTWLFDTQARILLKLGQINEAYTIVRSCQRKDPGFGGFNDIIETPGYQSWNNDLESGVLNDLTTEEEGVLNTAARIHATLKTRVDSRAADSATILEHMPPREIMKFREAKMRFGISHYHKDDDCVLVLTGDVVVKDRVSNHWLNKQLEGLTWEGKLYGVIVDGNLTVDGDVYDDEYFELTVRKDLRCDNLFSYDGVIRIYGDAYVTYGVLGEYNDGSLNVYGQLHTPYIINRDHDMPTEAVGDYIHIEGGNGTERESLIVHPIGYSQNSQRLLVDGVWDEEDTFSVNNFFEIVRRGDNPFKAAVANP